jgi:hypothetical protein
MVTARKSNKSVRLYRNQASSPNPRRTDMKARLYFDVQFNGHKTDPEGLASAMETLIETAMSTPGVMEEHGDPNVGECFVLDTKAALEHASTVNRVIVEYTDPDRLIENGGNELGELLAPVVEFLRKLAGKK